MIKHPEKDKVKLALRSLEKHVKGDSPSFMITFNRFLHLLRENPERLLRNIFQVFHDMIHTYVGDGVDEYPDDPESIHYVHYDMNKLFVENSDNPFFADRIFANRLMNQIKAMKTGAQQNKIYIFEGPPGSGKSIFLNNLLRKFEEYTQTKEGTRYEIVWRLDKELLGSSSDQIYSEIAKHIVIQELENKTTRKNKAAKLTDKDREFLTNNMKYPVLERFLEIPCPSHDHPILLIPKEQRRSFIDDLFENNKFKYKLFTEKEYSWIFKDSPCTFCSSLFEALSYRMGSTDIVFDMVFARPTKFNRRLGNGISVYNPGDKEPKLNVMTDDIIQKKINDLMQDSNLVRYMFSRYAKTNGGIYALMDIKSHNIERLIELHNVISEGLHKIEDIEENVSSLFIALMNPEDRKNIEDIPSFSDRVERIDIPYILDHKTEVAIYRNQFGKYIDDFFLPKVLHNFARVIISTRINVKSDAMKDWIPDSSRYELYCDKNLQLLKMEIYAGYIPPWLQAEDLKRFTAERRKRIIGESVSEGQRGLSGRESIKIFSEFMAKYKRRDQMISMSSVYNYFTNVRKDLKKLIPDGFLDSLIKMYDYNVLQQIKESLFYYNVEQISRNIKNYLFAVNFDPGTTELCKYTGDKIEISESYLKSIELFLLDESSREQTEKFRQDLQEEYSATTLTKEILVEGKKIDETQLYQKLYDLYIYNLKGRVLEPLITNDNFRRAIKSYGEEDFKTFDQKIRNDVTFLINNLQEKYRYTDKGAKEVCIYVIDNDIPQMFS